MTRDDAPRQPRRVLADAAMLAAVAVVGLLLALQGWRNTGPAIDMVAYFSGAEDLLRHGILPTHGDVSSYGSFSPPGAAWFMAPGMLVFDDPRLFEKLGSAALHVVTLFGIYLLAREAFGRGAAFLAVAIYGLSGLALTFAGSLWPIGHPVFAVWVTLLGVRWATRRDARYLGAALITFAIGMYDAMRIAPLGLILPALWVAYRPPVAPRWLAIAAAIALVVWLPYLRLEIDRGFADLRSQLTLQNIVPADYRDTWCDPGLVIRTIVPPAATAGEPTGGAGEPAPAASPADEHAASSLVERVITRARTALSGLLATYAESAPWRPFALLLLALTLAAMAATAVRTGPARQVLARFPSRYGRLVGPAPDPASASREPTRHALLLATLVPWLILLAVAEPGLQVRYLWLWPVQAIWLGAFFADMLARRIPGRLVWSVELLLLAGLLVNPLDAHLGSWLEDGWAGADPPEVIVADALANEIRSDGRTSAAIGYRTFIYEFMAVYNVIDPNYRVGTEFDLLFRYREGITNTNRCPEGVSPADEYRIIQTEPLPGADVPRSYFDVPVTRGFHPIAVFYRYQLLKHD